MLTSLQNNCKGTAVSLSARLSAIAESLPRGGTICDVGSDHGILPLYLVQKGLVAHTLVTDLNDQPLERAKKAFREAGVFDKADFILTDGILDVLSYSPDAYVIAGMGGETISGILLRALSGIPKETFFAFQPMTKQGELREFLYRNGFRISDEKAVSENGKSFLLIFAFFDGIKRIPSEDEVLFGEFLPYKKDAETADHFDKLLKSMEKKKLGKIKAKLSVNEDERRIERIISILEGIHEDSRD